MSLFTSTAHYLYLRFRYLGIAFAILLGAPICGIKADLPRQIGAGKTTAETDAYATNIRLLYAVQGGVMVALNNGSLWYAQTPTVWFVGDSVTLENSTGIGWLMFDSNAGTRAQVQLAELEPKKSLKITSIEKSGGKITLTDGSSWEPGWWQRIWAKTHSWQIADNILIMPLRSRSGVYGHVLINGDRLFSSVEIY